MKKRICVILCFLIGVLVLGCSQKQEGTSINLYYINPEGNGLVEVEYTLLEKKDAQVAAEEVLDMLQNPENIKKHQPALAPTVEITEVVLNGERVEISFDENYRQLEKSAEVLLRAAVVQSLVQVKGINYVSFYVDGQPLQDSNGNTVGAMSAEDFVQNTGSSLQAYQKVELELYFANKEGTKLKKEKRAEVHYNTNTSMEKLVVEQILKGTSSNKRSATIPSTVKLLGVSVKDGICYVNFNSAFLEDSYDQKPEVAIYSIVNSIIANGNVTKVQILIDGSQTAIYKNAIDLSETLEWRNDLIEE